MTKLCVPLTATSGTEMAGEIEAAARTGADMIELRLDYLTAWDPDSIRGLMASAGRFGGEVIATCRIAAEGGQWDGDEAERISLLEAVGLAGADYLDVEYDAWRVSANGRQKVGLVCEVNADSDRPRRKLILSKHDFERTPADLDALFEQLANEPAHVVKLACRAETIVDSLRMLDALRKSAASRPTIGLSMGETGGLTRVLAAKCGGLLTFGSLATGKESAPGQLTIEQMRSQYRWDTLGPQTTVYGVIGCPVAHSMSPAILNRAFGEIGYDAVYLPMRVEPPYDSLAAYLDGCLARPWLDLRGCSVTIPHKANLLRWVEQRGGEIEPLARRIGVANTLRVEPGEREDGSDARVAAYNTDYRGAMDALCTRIGCRADALGERSVAVLGAGGVSRAIVAGLSDAGCRVVIYNRTASKATALAEEFGAEARPWEERRRLETDVVVNGTSIGMWPNVEETPLPGDALAENTVVFDTVYNPMETRLLREARRHGCTTIDGVSMFVNQAAAQFERWTGQPAPVEPMRQVVVAKLSDS